MNAKQFALCVLTCSMTLSGHAQRQVDFTIEGEVPIFLKGTYVYLRDMGDSYTNQPETKLDSAIVDSHGHFVIKNRGPYGRMFNINAGVVDADVILEEGTISVDMSKNFENLGTTPLNRRLRDYKRENSALLIDRGQALGRVEDNKLLSAREASYQTQHIKDSTTAIALGIAAKYIRANTDNDVAEAALAEALRYTGANLAAYDSLYALMGHRAVNNKMLQGTMLRLERVRSTSPGCQFKDFTVAHGNLDGSTARLSDYVGRGKYVLVDFWASWCFWCRAEFPTLAKVYKQHKGDNFEILGLVVDDKLENTQKAMAEEKLMVWPQIVNAGETERNLYGVYGIPEIILFSPDGTIIARGLRGEQLVETVEKALSGQM